MPSPQQLREALRTLGQRFGVISGGQTGVDRAALDAAIACGIPHGGWCPRGRLAEDGTIPQMYKLVETPSDDYAERTRRNVQDSDGTLILCGRAISNGTRLTMEHTLRTKGATKLFLVDYHRFDAASVEAIAQWLGRKRIAVLNVAGPRESTSPGVYARSRPFLQAVFEAGRNATCR